MKFYYQKYHLFFYAGRPLYNTYYFSIRQALPIFWLKIDFWGIMPINLGGYNPHMALGPMGQKIGKAYPNCINSKYPPWQHQPAENHVSPVIISNLKRLTLYLKPKSSISCIYSTPLQPARPTGD